MTASPSDVATGHWRLQYEHDYLGWPDLRGRDVTLTISKVVRPELEMVRGSVKEKKRRLVLHFEELKDRPAGTPRMWVCNITCAMTVASMHGDEVQKWLGKQITLYPDMTVKAFGRQGAIRVRPTVSRNSRSQATGDNPPASDWSPDESSSPASPAK